MRQDDFVAVREMHYVQGTYPVCEELIDPLYEAIENFAISSKLDETEYYDEVTGKRLDPKLVKIGCKSELDTADRYNLWTPVRRSELGKGVKIIGTRWVYVDKGDKQNPNVRCRLCAKEIKRLQRYTLRGDANPEMSFEFFAAMPDPSVFKMLITFTVCRQLLSNEGIYSNVMKFMAYHLLT